MFQNINNKTLLKDKFLATKKFSKKELKNAIDKVIQQIDANIKYFGDSFQSPQTFDNRYKKMDNIEWTDGFWTGMLWLAYEYTQDEKYKKLATKHVDSYLERIEKKIEVDHHDMGFLYSLSCVAAYMLTGNQKAKAAALLAAKNLASRYKEKEKFIQAWNSVEGNNNYRLIIDCLLNVPLLHWATKNGNIDYTEIAINHFNTSLHTVIRPDGTTFHTYYFDEKTGLPLYGKTRQGYNDDSCWARGQAWGIYGIPLTLKYQNDNPSLDPQTEKIYYKVVNQFLNNLGTDDQVAYWDLIFNDDKTQSRDSSASAIAVCGMLEMNKYLKNEKDKEMFLLASHHILRSLSEKYAVYEVAEGAPVLYHGVYSWHSGKGVDEGNIWGDYFYFEALIRLWKDWQLYW